MPAPAFVGAGAGTFATTGSGTVSKTSCSAGNLLLIHFVVAGTTIDWSAFSNITNISNLAGTPGAINGVVNGRQIGSTPTYENALFIARVTANGTCSADFTVGASGEDIFCRMFEFSGAHTGTTVASVLEEGADTNDGSFGTGTTISTVNDMTTNGADRLGLQFVGVAGNVSIGDFTGESGGIDFVEAVAEYAEASGATCTLQLQTATITNPTTGINTGTTTIASEDWGVIYTSIIPAAAVASTATLRVARSGMRW